MIFSDFYVALYFFISITSNIGLVFYAVVISSLTKASLR